MTYKKPNIRYKRGGRLRKYQVGDYTGIPSISRNPLSQTGEGVDYSGLSPVSSPATGNKKFLGQFMSNPDNVRAASSILSTGLNSFTGDRRSGDRPGGKYVNNAFKGYDNNKMSNAVNLGLGAAASLDPTGTSSIIKAGVDAGKAIGNVVRNEDEYGISQSNTQEVIGNIFDPIGGIQSSINLGRKKGVGEGLANWATFGVSGRKTKMDDLKKAQHAETVEDAMLSYGDNTGNYRNDGIYAQKGAFIREPDITDEGEPNAEIEDGELIIGNPANTKLMGDVDTSMTSSFVTKVHGDKHGQDTDRDGREGIPLISEGNNYIASNYLGIDGKKASKKNPSVAKAIEPHAKYLHNAENNPNDKYKNTSVGIAMQKREIERKINEAERNKFKEEIAAVAKKKDATLEDVLATLKNMPAQNLTPDEKLLLEGALEAGAKTPTMLEQLPQQKLGGNLKTINNNSTMGFNNFYRRGGYRKQMGGAMDPMAAMMGGEGAPQEQQGPPESSEYMNQLAEGAPGTEEADMAGVGQVTGLSPEVEEMFNQLPPEMQQQVLELPPDQMEIAVINMYEEMNAGGEEMDPMAGMEGDVDPMAMMGGEEGMMDPAMMGAEGEEAALMRMGGYNRYKSGGMMKKGCKVKYKMGGRVMQGTFQGYDRDGSMVID